MRPHYLHPGSTLGAPAYGSGPSFPQLALLGPSPITLQLSHTLGQSAGVSQTRLGWCTSPQRTPSLCGLHPGPASYKARGEQSDLYTVTGHSSNPKSTVVSHLAWGN